MKIVETNPRNEHCVVDGAAHRYWIGDNADEDTDTLTLGELTPATRLIGQFYVVSPWTGEKCDVDFGNRVHRVAECCLRQLKSDVYAESEDERKAFSTLWQYARRIRDNNEVVFCEKPVFGEYFGVAGTVDLVFRCNGRVYVCDWKTGDAMLPAKCKFNAPFGHLVADPLTIYSLQCSMYQVMLEMGGYITNEPMPPARLLWLHKDADAWKVDALTCRDLRREAAMMIAMRGYTPWYADWKKRCPF